MKTIKASGGRSVAVRLDTATLARLDYLAAYFLAVHGLQVGQSVLVRRALSVLTEEVSKLVLRERKNGPEDGRVVLAGMLLVRDAENNAAPCPWRKEFPALDDVEQFPTYTELNAPSKAKARSATTISPQEFISDEANRDEEQE